MVVNGSASNMMKNLANQPSTADRNVKKNTYLEIVKSDAVSYPVRGGSLFALHAFYEMDKAGTRRTRDLHDK